MSATSPKKILTSQNVRSCRRRLQSGCQCQIFGEHCNTVRTKLFAISVPPRCAQGDANQILKQETLNETLYRRYCTLIVPCHRTTAPLKSTRVSICFREISRLRSAFTFLRWFKLAHIHIQVSTLHDGCKQAIDQQISAKISKKNLLIDRFRTKIDFEQRLKRYQQKKDWKDITMFGKSDQVAT